MLAPQVVLAHAAEITVRFNPITLSRFRARLHVVLHNESIARLQPTTWCFATGPGDADAGRDGTSTTSLPRWRQRERPDVALPLTRRALIASDHLPLGADLRITFQRTWLGPNTDVTRGMARFRRRCQPIV
jgi:hypothetical protein